jgi:hypothetical protein
MVCSGENLCPIGVVIWLGSADTRSHPRHGLGQVVAAMHAGDGGGIDGSRLVTQRSAALPGAALAATPSAVAHAPGKGLSNGVGSVCRQAGKEGCIRG